MASKNITYEELKELLSKYINEEEKIKQIDKAYNFCCDKWEGKKRLTGDDYVSHLVNVAYILAEIKADSETICGALLHDVLEDNRTSVEELNHEFGNDITNLVSGVIKINKLSFGGDNEAILANHRKIIVGLSEDVRVIIIKLADRLHNMRTLWVHPESV